MIGFNSTVMITLQFCFIKVILWHFLFSAWSKYYKSINHRGNKKLIWQESKMKAVWGVEGGLVLVIYHTPPMSLFLQTSGSKKIFSWGGVTTKRVCYKCSHLVSSSFSNRNFCQHFMMIDLRLQTHIRNVLAES